MNSKYLFATLGAIDDRLILAVADVIELKRRKRATTSVKKIIRIVLIAAMLATLLAACGYAVYRATMSYREPEPSDSITYYLTPTAESKEYIEVNNGECALAIHFDTEEYGLAHAFYHNEKASPGLVCTGFTGINSVWEFFQIFSDENFVKTPNFDKEKALKKTGLTQAEAQSMYRSAEFTHAAEPDGEKIRVNLQDSPQLSQTDLILGWPEGTATVVREDTWGEYHRLEVLIETRDGNNESEVNKHMFLFHPTEQYLLSFSARDQYFTFEDMELVADSLELITLDLEYALVEGRTNFSVTSNAAG